MKHFLQFLKNIWFPLLIFGVSIGYFLMNINKPEFVDNALGNLFATIMGVLAGVLLGLEIDRFRQEAQAAKEKNQKAEEIEVKTTKEKAEKEETLKTIINHLSDELHENKKCLERLQTSLEKAESSNLDLWEWLVAISESLGMDSYLDLVSFDPERKLWRDIDAYLIIAYPMMIKPLCQRIKESRAKTLYLSHQGDQTSADEELAFVRNLPRMACQRVKEAITEVDRFRLQKGYIQSLPRSNDG